MPFSRSISRTASTISCVISPPRRPLARSDDLAAQALARRLHTHLPSDCTREVLACAERPLDPRRGDLDRVAVEIRAEDTRHLFAERMVDPTGGVDVDAEALLARQLERQNLDARQRGRNGAGNLAIQLFLLGVGLV
jgi:hypothetical protein